MSEQGQEAQFVMQRIYLKDLSFESPRSPDVFLKQWSPKVNLDMNSSNNRIGDDLFEVTLTLTVTAKNEAEETVYLAEVQQAGIFLISGMPEENLAQTLGGYCPNILFPYAREAIDTIVVKGSFPPLMLAPVNFEAVFEQAKARAEAENAPVQ